MAFPHLFSPLQLGNIELPNRIVHVPTDISSSHADGEVSERDIHHHRDIARGGTGFVIVGATSPDMKTGRPTVTCLVADGDNYIPGLARLAESMHRYGAKCAVQLQHPGRQSAIPRYNTLGATDRVLKLPWSAGHEIVYENADEKGKEIREASIAEILELVDLFSDAAWRVKQAGFDAVELHAAHGYLLSEFMSPYLNMRTDRFGGSFENRMRFPLAVIDSIRRKCGRSYPILVRYSFEEWCPGGRGMDEGIETARVLEQAGVAALDLSQGMQESPGAGFDPMHYPQGWATYAAEATKKAVRIPVITSHSLRDPEYCEQILAEGKTDLVGPRPPAARRSVLAGQGAARQGPVDPALHLVPRWLLAGIADGPEGDRLLDQRGLRPARSTPTCGARTSRSGWRSSVAARPGWRQPASRPSAVTT